MKKTTTDETQNQIDAEMDAQLAGTDSETGQAVAPFHIAAPEVQYPAGYWRPRDEALVEAEQDFENRVKNLAKRYKNTPEKLDVKIMKSDEQMKMRGFAWIESVAQVGRELAAKHRLLGGDKPDLQAWITESGYPHAIAQAYRYMRVAKHFAAIPKEQPDGEPWSLKGVLRFLAADYSKDPMKRLESDDIGDGAPEPPAGGQSTPRPEPSPTESLMETWHKLYQKINAADGLSEEQRRAVIGLIAADVPPVTDVIETDSLEDQLSAGDVERLARIRQKDSQLADLPVLDLIGHIIEEYLEITEKGEA